MRTQARVAVIGGGALGASLLYDLAPRGWTDTILVEKGDLTSGSTWHAAGLADIGYQALDSLRLERFIDLGNGDFIGRDALLQQRDRGIDRRLECLTIELRASDDMCPGGGEPVWNDEELIDYLRAAQPGHAVGRTIGLAYLHTDRAMPDQSLEVEILGERRPATVVRAPLYDREGGRMRL